MLWPQSEVPHLHLERAKDREGGSESVWCADYWLRECSGKGWWWRQLKEANKPLGRPKVSENGFQNERLPTLINLKNC